MKGAVIGVSITPGHTQFTRTPGANSRAIVRVRLTTPPLDAAYAGDIEPPTSPKIDPMLVTAPWPLARRATSAAREARYVPLRLMSSTRCHSPGGGSASRPAALTPAQFTSVVRRPNQFCASATIAAHDFS